MDLFKVLDILAGDFAEVEMRLGDWEVRLVAGGRNNRLFRVTGPVGDLAVKFYRIDSRDRAGREFQALTVLRSLGLEIAPQPLLLERARVARPLTVQTWLPGRVHEGPPQSEEEWQRLVEHYNAIHSVVPGRVRPANTEPPLPGAFMTFQSAGEAVERVLAEIATFPGGAMRPGLLSLVRRLEGTVFPAWPAPEVCLSRCDPSTGNLLRREGAWASVDWEYAGWGDPAFEIGDLMTHPHYRSVSEERWEWFIDALERVNEDDLTFRTRAWTYYAIFLARWVGVFSRYWHQRDSGQVDSERLGQFPEEWWAALPEEYENYRARAEARLALFENH